MGLEQLMDNEHFRVRERKLGELKPKNSVRNQGRNYLCRHLKYFTICIATDKNSSAITISVPTVCLLSCLTLILTQLIEETCETQ